MTAQAVGRVLDKHLIRRLIQEKLGDADVRTDQCDVVRVYWRGRTAFIRRQVESGVEVRVALRSEPGTYDFSEPYIVDTALDEKEVARKALYWLQKVHEANMDLDTAL